MNDPTRQRFASVGVLVHNPSTTKSSHAVWVGLHGFAQNAAAWTGLAQRNPSQKLFAIDLPGHGELSTCRSGMDFNQAVDRLAAAMRDFTSMPIHLLGYSMGARIGLGLLCRHPSMFCAASFVAARYGLTSEQDRQQRRQQDRAWLRLLDQGIEQFAEAWAEQTIFASQRSLPAESLDRQQQMRRGHDPQQLACALRLFGLSEMPSYDLAAVRCPVQLIVGEHDAKFLAAAAELREQLVQTGQRCELEIVSACGHNVLLERESAVSEALLTFSYELNS